MAADYPLSEISNLVFDGAGNADDCAAEVLSFLSAHGWRAPVAAPPASWRTSPDGYGVPTLWDTAGDPRAWAPLVDACSVPAAVWNWIAEAVPALESEREGDPDVVVATVSFGEVE
jgi:hypothetical protein